MLLSLPLYRFTRTHFTNPNLLSILKYLNFSIKNLREKILDHVLNDSCCIEWVHFFAFCLDFYSA